VLRFTRFVGADLQQRVKDAIAALGYSPNFLAAGLRERKSRLIGIVVPDITASFFGGLFRQIEELAAGSDYQILLADTQENAVREQERIRALLRRRADGLIIFPCCDHPAGFEEISRSGIPTVVVDRVEPDSVFASVSLFRR
jgi:LacI family transcriptional regulator, galactose operon repressor